MNQKKNDKPATLGDQLLTQLGNARLPGVTQMKGWDYTSESEIRENIDAAITRGPRKISPAQAKAAGIEDLVGKGAARQLTDEEREKSIEKWISRQVDSARKQNRLMTDQQLRDWRLGVRFTAGTRARYVGPTRDEVTQNKLIVTREHGQTGLITSILEGKEGRLLTFRPDTPVMPQHASPGTEAQYVDLQVREYTPGWLFIERIPL